MSNGCKGVTNPDHQGLGGLCGLIADSGPLKEAKNKFFSHRKKVQRVLDILQTHTMEDVWHGIASGRFQFWPLENSIIITDITEYPRCKVLTVFIAAGDMDEILSMDPVLVQFARKTGCRFVEVTGRKGWERVLGRIGYKPMCPYLRKEV